MRFSRVFLLLLGLIALPQAALATIMTRTVEITASDFVKNGGGGSGPPISPAYLLFSITLDTTTYPNLETSGLDILSTNLPFPFTYGYNAGGDRLTIGVNAGTDFCYSIYANNGVCVTIYNFSTAPSATVQEYFDHGVFAPDKTFWDARNVTARVVESVPEPETWALMIGGLGMVAMAMRRQHRPSPRLAMA